MGSQSGRKSLSTEETYDKDTTDLSKLRSTLIAMTEKLAYQMRDESKLTSCITVKIRYSNFDTHTTQARIAYTSCDHTLISKVKELFEKVYQRRMLIRLIGVRFSHLVGGAYQIDMFDDSEQMIKLYQAMDKLKKKYGDDTIQRAISSGYELRKFNPFNGRAS
jgi:DNA polymerase-4